MKSFISLEDYRVSPEATDRPNRWMLVHPNEAPLFIDVHDRTIDLLAPKVRLWVDEGFNPRMSTTTTLDKIARVTGSTALNLGGTFMANGQEAFQAFREMIRPEPAKCQRGRIEDMCSLLSLLAHATGTAFKAIAGRRTVKPWIGGIKRQLEQEAPVDLQAISDVATDILHWHQPTGTVPDNGYGGLPTLAEIKKEMPQTAAAGSFGLDGNEASVHEKLELVDRLEEFYATAQDDLGIDGAGTRKKIDAIFGA